MVKLARASVNSRTSPTQKSRYGKKSRGGERPAQLPPVKTRAVTTATLHDDMFNSSSRLSKMFVLSVFSDGQGRVLVGLQTTVTGGRILSLSQAVS